MGYLLDRNSELGQVEDGEELAAEYEERLFNIPIRMLSDINQQVGHKGWYDYDSWRISINGARRRCWRNHFPEYLYQLHCEWLLMVRGVRSCEVYCGGQCVCTCTVAENLVSLVCTLCHTNFTLFALGRAPCSAGYNKVSCTSLGS